MSKLTDKPDEGMRILHFYAENVKRIEVVDFTPEPNIQKISGDNAQGKTSVLDCILYALGGIDELPPVPIRTGMKEGVIRLDLGDYVVKRWLHQGRTSELEIRERKNGVLGERGIASPQGFLKSIIGKIAFDPLNFVRMKQAEQVLELRRLVGLDFKELDREIEELYARRTPINVEAKRLRAEVKEIESDPRRMPPADTPDEEINIAELTDRQTEAYEHNSRIEAQKAQKAAHLRKASQHGDFIAEREKEIRALEDRIAAMKREVAAAKIDLTAEEGKAEAVEIDDPVDPMAWTAELKNAQARNAWVLKKRELTRLRDRLQTAETEAGRLTEQMEAREAAKAQALREARMPIDGLALQQDTVYFQGLPLEQASSAEQVRVGLAIAMAANKRLKVIRIVDATLLGPEAMRHIEQTAVEHNFQVWMEVVDPDGGEGIHMVEGKIAAIKPSVQLDVAQPKPAAAGKGKRRVAHV